MNLCGDCKHWHKWDRQPYRCLQGDCDKIAKGSQYKYELDGKEYVGEYSGYSFEDECYDDDFNCFEGRSN